MNKIDSIIVRSIKNKSIQAYNSYNERIYVYSDNLNDTIEINKEILTEARANENNFFTVGRKEAIAYHDKNNSTGIVVVTAAFDEEGKRNLQRLKIFLWLSFVCGILIAFISGYFFSKILLRPIRKIADEVNIISAQSLHIG